MARQLLFFFFLINVVLFLQTTRLFALFSVLPHLLIILSIWFIFFLFRREEKISLALFPLMGGLLVFAWFHFWIFSAVAFAVFILTCIFMKEKLTGNMFIDIPLCFIIGEIIWFIGYVAGGGSARQWPLFIKELFVTMAVGALFIFVYETSRRIIFRRRTF